jgi:uncharacterized protein
MTNEERDIISQFIARVGGAGQQSGFAGGSVPASQPALPPVDRDADAFIAQNFNQYPEARYRITQLAFVQEHALVEAQNRIQRLEWELQQARQALQQAQQQAGQKSGGGGFFSGLFGGGNRPQAAPPQGDPRWGGQGGPGYQGGQPQQPNYQQSAPPPPQYPPNYQQGMFQQRGGSGFLGSALTTAAGVAGGLVAGNALMSLFSGREGGGFGGAPAGGSPWATPAAPTQDYVDTGSWDQSGGAAPPAANQDYVDNGTWDQPAAPDTDPSWTDNSGGGSDSGWDNSGGGNSDDTF